MQGHKVRVENMRLLITGSTGFIGRHVVWAMENTNLIDQSSTFITPTSVELDLLAPSATTRLINRFRPTHVLHLAWSETVTTNYDQSEKHALWSNSTFQLISELSQAGVVNWVVGTGLEQGVESPALSPYGVAKLELKQKIIDLDTAFARWISMPYVFSLFHERPRIVRSCFQSEALHFPESIHDFLEIRDVAYQIARIIYRSEEKIESVTSSRQTSNAVLCSKIHDKKDSFFLKTCTCVDKNGQISSSSEDYFTSLLLD
jgi:hypothetical protein